MRNFLGVVFLFVGVVLFAWGVSEWRALSSHTPELTPELLRDKVVAMVALGALLGIAGLARLSRSVARE